MGEGVGLEGESEPLVGLEAGHGNQSNAGVRPRTGRLQRLEFGGAERHLGHHHDVPGPDPADSPGSVRIGRDGQGRPAGGQPDEGVAFREPAGGGSQALVRPARQAAAWPQAWRRALTASHRAPYEGRGKEGQGARNPVLGEGDMVGYVEVVLLVEPPGG